MCTHDSGSAVLTSLGGYTVWSLSIYKGRTVADLVRLERYKFGMYLGERERRLPADARQKRTLLLLHESDGRRCGKSGLSVRAWMPCLSLRA